MLAFALLSTGFPCGLIHDFVFISVFRFDLKSMPVNAGQNPQWRLFRLHYSE